MSVPFVKNRLSFNNYRQRQTALRGWEIENKIITYKQNKMEHTKHESTTETQSCKGGVSGCSLTFEDLTDEEKFYWAIVVMAYIEAKKEPDEKFILERIALGRAKNSH